MLCCFRSQRSGRSPQRDFHTDSRSHISVSRWNWPPCPRGRSRHPAGSRRNRPHVAACYRVQVRTSASAHSAMPPENRPNSPLLDLTDQQQYASNESKLPDPNRIRSRVPPNVPKLFIPSTVTKFPPEITVTPPTPTLLSPKGSISEETKQRLKVLN